MEKKTLQQLSQNQPFPHLYLIGSTHQIFQKKRNKRYKFPGWSASFCITSTFLFRTQKFFTFGSTLEQRLSRDANQAHFFYHGYATLHAHSLKKCFISNFSFFQKLVPLSLRRHLQTLRYQRSSTKSRLKITSSRLL